MQRDFQHSPEDASKNVPVAMFVGDYFYVAVRIGNAPGWTWHTANTGFTPLFPETILYTHGW